MFYHVKELQFNARVSKPDTGFATLLPEGVREMDKQLSIERSEEIHTAVPLGPQV